MKKFVVVVGLFFVGISQAAFLELKSVGEFESLVQDSQVPVLVQFSAYWCQPCQDLRAVFHRVAPSYGDEQVKMAYVDADLNPSLRQYLQGGYPTVRTFINGSLAAPAFTGSRSESFVRSFINKVINGVGFEISTVQVSEFCPVN